MCHENAERVRDHQQTRHGADRRRPDHRSSVGSSERSRRRCGCGGANLKAAVLGEVDDTSILRTGLSNGYWDPLNELPISRLLPPRSGLERSDFVHWRKADVQPEREFLSTHAVVGPG